MTTFDVEAVRKDFPILGRELSGGKPLVYLDSANTAHKPRVVIDAMEAHYREHNANVARAVHQLGAEATEAFEGARQDVARFIGASRPEEVVFTKNASEALNLVARVLADDGRIGAGKNVVITEMEHHSNIVPWQQACARTGAELRWFGVTDEGRLDVGGDFTGGVIDEHTAVVSVTWVSNALGTINPVREIVRAAHAVGALVVLDASQAVPQMPVDVTEVGADFVAFTGHKVVGPTGVGVLYGTYDLLAELPPFLGGGEMIEQVSMERSTFAPPPARFEAGTPPIAQAVGLGAAVRYLTDIGMEHVQAHEAEMTAYTLDQLSHVGGVKVMGPVTAKDRGGAISFQLEGVHPHDIAQLLDSEGVAVRAGHHCAKPVHRRFGVQSSIRVSPYLYTTKGDIDTMIGALEKTKSFFGGAL